MKVLIVVIALISQVAQGESKNEISDLLFEIGNLVNNKQHSQETLCRAKSILEYGDAPPGDLHTFSCVSKEVVDLNTGVQTTAATFRDLGKCIEN